VIDMALLSVIRRWHLRDGHSIREIARRTGLRWTRLVRQFGGLAKVDRVGFYAANFSIISAVA
jgi:hypothetical protein